jgi:hypothetical protein
MIKLSVKKVVFPKEVTYVKTAKEAFSLVKSTETHGEKIIYAIMFLGLFNNVARKGAFDFLNVLLRK